MKTTDAIGRAKQENLDLVEISATAKPPVAQIMDYGKYQYTQKKLRKKIYYKCEQKCPENGWIKDKKRKIWILQTGRKEIRVKNNTNQD